MILFSRSGNRGTGTILAICQISSYGKINKITAANIKKTAEDL
jgi:hypothetical protein